LALEVDGITHKDEDVAKRDVIRQQELERAGVRFLRFDALLVLNKVEAAVKEIRKWIEDFEKQNGVSEFAKKKREKIKKSGGDPSLPFPGRDACH
jgi:hypothetical protein